MFKHNDELTIAHLSDIHYEKNFNLKKFDKILKNIYNEKPDYICITGDVVDNLMVAEIKEMSNLNEFLNKLAEISQVIISLGNHDIREYKGMKDNGWYNKLNKKIILLNNSSYEDKFFRFYGLTMQEDYYKNECSNKNILSENLQKIEISRDKYNILLVHSPINFETEKIKAINKFDLVLTGHTHNGLTPHFIPGNFGLIAPNHGLFVKNARNSFTSGKGKVIINGGITKISNGTGLGFMNSFFNSDIVYIYLKKGEKN